MPFYGTVLGKQKITLCFASYPSRVGKWGVPQFALPIARRSWQTVCQNIPWPPNSLITLLRSHADEKQVHAFGRTTSSHHLQCAFHKTFTREYEVKPLVLRLKRWKCIKNKHNYAHRNSLKPRKTSQSFTCLHWLWARPTRTTSAQSQWFSFQKKTLSG